MPKISSFRIKNYRSLKDVHVDGLGPVAVFYGASGAGKSSIVRALGHFLTLAGKALAAGNPPGATGFGIGSEGRRYFGPEDAWAYGASLRSEAVVRFAFAELEPRLPTLRHYRLPTLELGVAVEFRHPSDSYPLVEFTELRSGSLDLRWLDADSGPDRPEGGLADVGWADLVSELRSFLVALFTSAAYWLVPDVRYVGRASRGPEGREDSTRSDRDRVRDLLRAKRHAEAFFLAANTAEDALHRDYQQLCATLTAPPLSRPQVQPVLNSATLEHELRERLPGTPSRRVPLDAAGFGVNQVYALLGEALLSGAACVAIEEPEAHLHGPTLGLQLRATLEALVAEGRVDQLLIVTHSDQFDLDPRGFFEVALRENADGSRETTVGLREEVMALYEGHIWSPGAALRALRDYLDSVADDHIVTWTGTTPLTAKDLRGSLNADPQGVAQRYANDLYRVAVAYLQSRKPRSG